MPTRKQEYMHNRVGNLRMMQSKRAWDVWKLKHQLAHVLVSATRSPRFPFAQRNRSTFVSPYLYRYLVKNMLYGAIQTFPRVLRRSSGNR